MARSLRTRLAVGQVLVLAAAVGGYAGLLFVEVRRAKLAELDAGLDAAAAGLEATLRLFPPHELDRDGPPDRPPDRPFRKGPKGDRPPPGPPPDGGPSPRDRLLAGLSLPGPPGASDAHFAVWRADGSVLKAGGPAPAERPAAGPGRPLRRFRGPDRERAAVGPGGTTLLVGTRADRLGAELAVFAGQLAGAGAFALAAGAGAGWWLAGRLVRPVARIAATAGRLTATNPTERVDTRGLDRELATLGAVLNGAFDRLAEAAARQARFTADASHELRTPLAVVRARAELALRRERTPADYRAALAGVLAAAERMSRLVDRLLLLARTDAAPPPREPVAIDEVVRDAVELLRPLADERGVILVVDVQSVTLTGDPSGLATVAENLISNAVRYDRPGGTVRVSLAAAGGAAVLAVGDTGPGIPLEAQPHLFERFFRVDAARDRAAGGSGLGLAIVKGVVDAHGGGVRCESELGRGTTFTVTLPAAG